VSVRVDVMIRVTSPDVGHEVRVYAESQKITLTPPRMDQTVPQECGDARMVVEQLVTEVRGDVIDQLAQLVDQAEGQA
jgi:hypothetical protein